jgi:hypothetical protein
MTIVVEPKEGVYIYIIRSNTTIVVEPNIVTLIMFIKSP